jgi:hypothetical protein
MLAASPITITITMVKLACLCLFVRRPSTEGGGSLRENGIANVAPATLSRIQI